MMLEIIQRHVNIRENYQHQQTTLQSNLPLQVLPGLSFLIKLIHKAKTILNVLNVSNHEGRKQRSRNPPCNI
jgi:hypothetical protein